MKKVTFIESLKSVLYLKNSKIQKKGFSDFENKIISNLISEKSEKIKIISANNSTLCAAPKQLSFE